jgi:hypothetical protein
MTKKSRKDNGGDNTPVGPLVKRKSWRDYALPHPATDMFPMLPVDELRVLGEDIKKNGLLIPIVIFEEGGKYFVLDGRNRLDAMDMASVEFLPEELIKTSTLVRDVDPYTFVISANIHRRHLTSGQKRELVAKLLKAKPERSDVATAKLAKVTDKTVAAVRKKMESRSEIPSVEKRVDTKGRKQPIPPPRLVSKESEPGSPPPFPPGEAVNICGSPLKWVAGENGELMAEPEVVAEQWPKFDQLEDVLGAITTLTHETETCSPQELADAIGEQVFGQRHWVYEDTSKEEIEGAARWLLALAAALDKPN